LKWLFFGWHTATSASGGFYGVEIEMLFKAEVYVELKREHLCVGCPFFDYMGDNFHECIIGERWQSEDNKRPEWCRLKEYKEWINNV